MFIFNKAKLYDSCFNFNKILIAYPCQCIEANTTFDHFKYIVQITANENKTEQSII